MYLTIQEYFTTFDLSAVLDHICPPYLCWEDAGPLLLWKQLWEVLISDGSSLTTGSRARLHESELRERSRSPHSDTGASVVVWVGFLSPKCAWMCSSESLCVQMWSNIVYLCVLVEPEGGLWISSVPDDHRRWRGPDSSRMEDGPWPCSEDSSLSAICHSCLFISNFWTLLLHTLVLRGLTMNLIIEGLNIRVRQI